jgi:hypothetical protein
MPRTAWAQSTTGLEALGFRKRHGGAFAGGGVTLTASHGWATLSASAARFGIEPGDAMLGRPGLWKPASIGGACPAIVFDVPLQPVIAGLDAADDDTGDAVDAIAAIAQWAVHTRPGADAPPWAPPRERLTGILPPETLFVRTGPYVQPARLDVGDGRLALRVTVCRPGDPLPAARRQWLDRLLADCRGWRMVRVGLREAGDGAAALDMEIDLTGAPPGVLEAALPIALDALQACFELLAATATHVSDPQRRSLALERDPAELLAPTTTKNSRSSNTRRTRA